MLHTRATDRPDHEQRVRELAYHLWEQDGRPHGRDVEFWERAREMVAMEEKPGVGLLPNPTAHPTMPTGQPEGVEEAESQANCGEFSSPFTDQGDRQQTPQRTRRTTTGKSTRSNSRPAGER